MTHRLGLFSRGTVHSPRFSFAFLVCAIAVLTGLGLRADDIRRVDFAAGPPRDLFRNTWGDRPTAILQNGTTSAPDKPNKTVACLKLTFGPKLDHRLSYWFIAFPEPVPVFDKLDTLSFRVRSNAAVGIKVPISPFGFIYHGPMVKPSKGWQTVAVAKAFKQLKAWCARGKRDPAGGYVPGIIVAVHAEPGKTAEVWIDDVRAAGPKGAAVAADLEMKQRRYKRVRVSVVTLPWDDDGRSLATVLDRLDEAGLAAKSDIVCLPMECVKTDGEPIPGPSSRAIARKAAEYNMVVIGNIREKDGEKTYITSFLCDRSGKIVGTYRKSHKLPDETMDLGDDLPVFHTDFADIAMRIGSDRFFADIDAVYAAKGARIVFWSQAPEPLEDEYLEDMPSAGRASDYRVFIACSRYSRPKPGWITTKFPPYRGCPIGRSYVINREGQRIACTSRKGSVATAVIRFRDLVPPGRVPDRRTAFAALTAPAQLPAQEKWKKRKIRVTAIENHVGIDDLLEKLDEAGRIGSDAVCTYEFVWFPLNGPKPSPEKLAQLEKAAADKRRRVAAKAKQWHMVVILAGVIERREVNEAIIYGRDGREIGRYRKIGTTYPAQIAGTETPVFETDFGRIAVKICADQGMVEIDRCYGVKGADIVFFPTQDWGPDALWRNLREISRCMDTQTFMVQATHSSSEVMHRSIIIDPCGVPVARSRYLAPGIVSAVIDLDNDRPRRAVRNFKPYKARGYLPQYQSTRIPEVRNDLLETILRQRRPELYQTLAPTRKLANSAPQPAKSARPAPPENGVVIENPRFRMVLGSDGVWQELVDRKTGRNWCWTGQKTPGVQAVFADGADNAHSAAFDGTHLTVRFAKHPTVLRYKVLSAPDWIRFALESVTGPRPRRLILLRAPVAVHQIVGSLLGMARNDKVAVCLMSGNMQTYGSARSRGKWADLRGYTQDGPGPKLEGAALALILCPSRELRTILNRAVQAFGLPWNCDGNGVPAKELPETKGSYWFLGFGEKDVDRVLALCRQSGIRQVMLNFGAWCTSAGHYPINTRNFPRGLDSLEATVKRLHKAGILVGMHTFASKVAKRDAYVTPVPDKRFWCNRNATVAENVTATQDSIRARETLAQWPGSPVCTQKRWEGGVRKHQEVILDDEIVQYDTIGPPGKFDTFLGCRRGAWKTDPAPHKAGTSARHYGVDGCINGYIIDQETDLLDEVHARLAAVFNACDFDMVYFDGGEDVDRRRFKYYATKFQAAAMGHFTKRPILHMGTVMTHRLWHSFARSGTVDTYLATMRGAMIARGDAADVQPVKKIDGDRVVRTIEYTLAGRRERWRTVKEHIDKSVRRAVRLEQTLMPAELGWFGIWPATPPYSAGLQLDEIEYLMVKSLAYDLPISLNTSFRSMDQHPLTPEILAIVKAYETLRRNGPGIPSETREKLRQLEHDFIMVRTPDTPKPEFVEVREVPEVAGSHDRVRAFVGAFQGGSVATVWHVRRGGRLLLEVPSTAVRATTFAGSPVSLEARDNAVGVPVNTRRTTLFFSGMPPENVRECLTRATFVETPPSLLWIQAETPVQMHGKMALGRPVGVREPAALGDVVVCTGSPNREKDNDWFCEYNVRIPHGACWTLWARVRYPSGADDSFWLVPFTNGRPGERIVLGNCGANGKKWHWTGRGSGVTTVPPGRPIPLTLPAGVFTFRVYAREGPGTPRRNPRLDCLCLSDDPECVPTDAAARQAFAAPGR